MKKIEQKDYHNFYKLFREIDCYVGVLGVLDGICHGDLYADDAVNPTVALMMTEDGHYLAGDCSNPVVNLSLQQLTSSDLYPEYAGIIFSASKLNEVKNLFGAKLYHIVERDNFVLTKESFTEAEPTGLTLTKVNRDNLTNFSDYSDYKTLSDGATFFWNEYKKSNKMNFCMLLSKEKEIVSKCIVCQESNSKNCCELDVETIEKFRHNGYGHVAASETIKQAFMNGYQFVYWCCDKDNYGSKRIAEKLGFKKVEESYLAWFDKKL